MILSSVTAYAAYRGAFPRISDTTVLPPVRWIRYPWNAGSLLRRSSLVAICMRTTSVQRTREPCDAITYPDSFSDKLEYDTATSGMQ